MNHLEQIKKIFKEANITFDEEKHRIHEQDGVVMMPTTDPDIFDPEPVFVKKVKTAINTGNTTLIFNDDGSLYDIDGFDNYDY